METLHIVLRPSCYERPYKSVLHPDEKMLEQVKEQLIWKETKLEDSLQPTLKAPFPQSQNREQLWE